MELETEQEITEEEAYKYYDEMLDETYGDFMDTYPASSTLKKVDEIAYNVGFNDWLDGSDYEVEND